MTSDFSRNLRALCAETGSFAQTCRDVGLNRQQFNRYINGHGRPSAHNLHRIARHFGIDQENLDLDHDVFQKQFVNRKPEPTTGPAAVISDIFRSQAHELRRFLGSYHVFFQTPSWPDRVFLAFVRLREEDGFVVSHTYERAISKDGSIRQKIRYAGLVAFRANRIFLVEQAFSDDGSISETILYPAHRQQIKYLKGQILGVAARPRFAPYSAPVVWKRISERVSAREALTLTGTYPLYSDKIDPVVRKYLATDLVVADEGN